MKDPFFIFKRPNGVVVEMNSKAAEELCLKLEAFGDDCSITCKGMRADLRKGLDALKTRGEKIAEKSEIEERGEVTLSFSGTL